MVLSARDLLFQIRPPVAPTPAPSPCTQTAVKVRCSPAYCLLTAPGVHQDLAAFWERAAGRSGSPTAAGGRGRGARWAPPPAGARAESERQRESSHPALLRTPRPTRRVRVLRGATAALGEPEASGGREGCPGGYKFPPASEPETRSALSFEGTAADSLPQGSSRQLPLLPGARALLKQPPGWGPRHPHPATDRPQSCPDSADLPFSPVPGPRPG